MSDASPPVPGDVRRTAPETAPDVVSEDAVLEDEVPVDAAVVDRIEDGGRAVLLVGPGEVELVVDAPLLPGDVQEGDWLRLTFRPDEALTAARRGALAERLERIRRHRGGGRFA
jgi:hypothetical protein